MTVRRKIVWGLLAMLAAGNGGPARGGDLPDSAADPELELMRATQEAFRGVASGAKRYLVRIETLGGSQPRAFVQAAPSDDPSRQKKSQNPFRESTGSSFRVADGPTTGIIYSSDGLIISSSFNFVREPLLITVSFSDGRRLAAELVARDQVRKLALLKVDATDLPVPKWYDVRDVRVGQWAVSLGLGFGGDAPSITVGIISAVNRMSGNAIQTDAKLSPANYGGPLCDLSGRFLGICVPMAQRPGELAGVEMYDSGVGFALTKGRVDEIVAVLKTGRSLYRGWLGIQIDRRQREAVVVGRLADPSPMRSAGVRAGDKIIGAGDKPILHYGHLVQALYMTPAGETVRMKMERDGEAFEVDVTLARVTELGPLPEEEEPFDPSSPADPGEEGPQPKP